MDGCQGHHHLDGGAVGVGDDVRIFVDGVGIDFRNDQRHIFFHAPGGAVVDNKGALFGKAWRILFRCRCSCREDGDVGAGCDGIIYTDHFICFALENDFLAHGAFRGGDNQFINLNFLFIKHLKHLRANQSGGPNHCDFHIFLFAYLGAKIEKKKYLFFRAMII